LFDLFTDEAAQLVIGGFLALPVTNTAPPEKVRATAQVKVVLFIPPHES
jgi:hypothetical protein